MSPVRQTKDGLLVSLRTWWAQGWLPGALLTVATLLAYQLTWQAGFIWDDDYHLTQNPCIVGPLGFKAIWTSSAAVYYPLVLTSFWVQHALWGLNPLPYHFVNIVLHAACAILLWQVLRRLNVPAPWFGAALWALHPVQVESVAWITELKNTQSCLFYLLAILFFLKWQADGSRAGGRGSEGVYTLALLCGVLAILSKASTVMLPVVLGLCCWWTDRRWRWCNALRLAPFFLISALASGWTIWEQKFHSGAVGPEWAQTWPERLVISGRIVWFYLGKLLWPHPLMFVYPRWTIDASHPTAWLPALAVLVCLFLLRLNRSGRMRPVLFAFACFLVSLFPVLGFFNVYFFRYSFVSDHFQYLASQGPLALAAAVIATALSSLKDKSRFLKPALCGALLLVLGMVTWRQGRMYRDIETLWRTTLAQNPAALLAHNNLGLLVLEKGHVDEATAHFQTALQLDPDFYDAQNSLGLVLLQQGQVQNAISHFQRALKVRPDFAKAHNNLGNALLEQGQTEQAVAHFQRALEISPRFALARYNLGNTLLQQGKLDGAIADFQKTLEINSSYPEAHYNLGIALLREGRSDEAVSHFRRALEIHPDYAEAHNNLGNVLLQKGQVQEAITQYHQALQLQPNSAPFHNNLANALVQEGELDEGIRQFQAGLSLEPGDAIAHGRLGDALVHKEQFDEAITQYQEAVRLKPDYAEAHCNLGVALGAKGQIDAAISHLQEALRLKPGDTNAQRNLNTALAVKAGSTNMP